MASELKRLQARFADAILLGESPGLSELAAGIRPAGRLSPEKAIGVYRDGYSARLSAALGETFEAVWSALGDDRFFEVCRSFIKTHPSCSPNLSDYGAEFPEFIGKLSEASEFHFLPELARFEWEFKNLFHEKDCLGISAAELFALKGAGDAKFSFTESMRLLRHRFGIYEIWKHRKDNARNHALGGPNHASRESTGEWLLLTKRAGDIIVSSLQAAEFEILGLLKAGWTLQEALEAALTDHPELCAERVSKLFALLAESGALVGIQRQ